MKDLQSKITSLLRKAKASIVIVDPNKVQHNPIAFPDYRYTSDPFKPIHTNKPRVLFVIKIRLFRS